MTDGERRSEFLGVEVLDDGGLTLRCRIEGKVVSIPPLRMLEGTEVRRTGDRGRLVIPWDVAVDLGLVTGS